MPMAQIDNGFVYHSSSRAVDSSGIIGHDAISSSHNLHWVRSELPSQIPICRHRTQRKMLLWPIWMFLAHWSFHVYNNLQWQLCQNNFSIFARPNATNVILMQNPIFDPATCAIMNAIFFHFCSIATSYAHRKVVTQWKNTQDAFGLASIVEQQIALLFRQFLCCISSSEPSFWAISWGAPHQSTTSSLGKLSCALQVVVTDSLIVGGDVNRFVEVLRNWLGIKQVKKKNPCYFPSSQRRNLHWYSEVLVKNSF